MQKILALALLIFAIGFLLRQLRGAARTLTNAGGSGIGGSGIGGSGIGGSGIGGCGSGGCGCGSKKPDIEVEAIKRS